MKFLDTKDRFDLISKIADRALELLRANRIETDKMSLLMDIDYTDQAIPLDLQKLLDFDDFNFSHDVFGIYRHFNRQTLQMDDFFLPRCAR